MSTTSDTHYYDGPPMYWIIPAGLAVGVMVVVAFESWTDGGSRGGSEGGRTAAFKRATFKAPGERLDPAVEMALRAPVDGVINVCNFYSGAALQATLSKSHLQHVYETLALVSALLLTVCVTFYTSNDQGDHLYGIVSCVANCALWMATLSSTFFAVIIHAMESDAQLQLLVTLFGANLMRVPMALFVWGTVLIFLEFILYFKLNVDPGFPCSMCLGTCFIIAPLFFHCLHKMGWAATVVHKEAALARKDATAPTVEDMRETLRRYVASKGDDNCLALDRDEYLASLPAALRRTHVTSVQTTFAATLFDRLVDRELQALDREGPAPGSSPRSPRGDGALKTEGPPALTMGGLELEVVKGSVRSV